MGNKPSRNHQQTFYFLSAPGPFPEFLPQSFSCIGPGGSYTHVLRQVQPCRPADEWTGETLLWPTLSSLLAWACVLVQPET